MEDMETAADGSTWHQGRLAHFNSLESFFILPVNFSLSHIWTTMYEYGAHPRNDDFWLVAVMRWNLWFRASVHVNEAGVTMARLVDYGLEIAVDEVFDLPEELRVIPVVAIECALAYLDTDDISQLARAEIKMYHMCRYSNDIWDYRCVHKEGSKMHIELKQDGLSIFEYL